MSRYSKDLQHLYSLYEREGYSCTKIPHKDEYLIGKIDEPTKFMRVNSYEEASRIAENIQKYEEYLKESYLRDLKISKQWRIYDKARNLFQEGKTIDEVKWLLNDQVPKEFQNSTILKDVLKAIYMEKDLIRNKDE